MKTILVDAVDTFVNTKGEIFQEMYEILEHYPNKKIILTGANDEQISKFGLDKMPYEVFSCKHDPEKTNTLYYTLMLERFKLQITDVLYFESNPTAVQSAQSLGIQTLYYDKDKKDLEKLHAFLDQNL